MIEGGLESRETVEYWRSMYEYYVPLAGKAMDEFSEEQTSYPHGGGGFSVYGESTRKAKVESQRRVSILLLRLLPRTWPLSRRQERMRP